MFFAGSFAHTQKFRLFVAVSRICHRLIVLSPLAIRLV